MDNVICLLLFFFQGREGGGGGGGVRGKKMCRKAQVIIGFCLDAGIQYARPPRCAKKVGKRKFDSVGITGINMT